jgi:hypothetical protein
MLIHPDTDDASMQEILIQIEDANAWEYEVQVKTIISKLQLTPLLEQTM